MNEEHDAFNKWELLRQIDIEDCGDDQCAQAEDRREPLAVREYGIRLVDDDAVFDIVADED